MCFRIPAKLDSVFPRALLTPPPLFYELYPEKPLEVDTVKFECGIAGVIIMMFGFLRNMKREMMVFEAFFVFFTVTLELNGRS